MASMNTGNQQNVEVQCIPTNHFHYEAKLKHFSHCAFKQLKLIMIINRWPTKYFSSRAIMQLEINLLYPVDQLSRQAPLESVYSPIIFQLPKLTILASIWNQKIRYACSHSWDCCLDSLQMFITLMIKSGTTISPIIS